MNQKSNYRATPSANPEYSDAVLIANFESEGVAESRTYDFRTHEGRHAYMRFMSWALRNGVTVTSKPATTIS